MTDIVSMMRIGPSGPVLGNPPALVGGPGSQVNSRCWRKQGDSREILIPMPGIEQGAICVPGLENVIVDMLANYSYDLEVDVYARGMDINPPAMVGSGKEPEVPTQVAVPRRMGVGPIPPGEQQYTIGVVFTLTGGGSVHYEEIVDCFDKRAFGRLHVLFTLDGTSGPPSPFDLMHVYVRSSAPTSLSLQYSPALTVVRLREYVPAA